MLKSNGIISLRIRMKIKNIWNHHPVEDDNHLNQTFMTLEFKMLIFKNKIFWSIQHGGAKCAKRKADQLFLRKENGYWISLIYLICSSLSTSRRNKSGNFSAIKSFDSLCVLGKRSKYKSIPQNGDLFWWFATGRIKHYLILLSKTTFAGKVGAQKTHGTYCNSPYS